MPFPIDSLKLYATPCLRGWRDWSGAIEGWRNPISGALPIQIAESRPESGGRIQAAKAPTASRMRGYMNARIRSAPRCDALTVAVEVLASAGDLLLNDVVTIPVLAAVRHGHRGIAGLLRIAIL